MRPWLAMGLLLVAGVASAQPALDAVLATLQQRYHFPGATVAWSGPGREQQVWATGLADPQRQLPMTAQHRMLAASIGKSFVAAAVVSEAMRGSLDLDAPLSDYLGDRRWYRRLPNQAQLTLRHLLNHTGGLPDHVYQPGFASLLRQTMEEGQAAPDVEAMVALILDKPPLFAVGEGWAYSDTGYLLAALALESSLDRPWTALVQERFLAPLDLHHTVPSDQRRIPGLAVGITAGDNAFGLPPRTADESGRLLWHPGIEGAGGGFASSAGDLATWGHLLWSGEVLGTAGTAQLLAGVPVDASDHSRVYGLAVLIEKNGPFGEVRGHRGWIPGYVSSLRYYPDYDVAIAIQINTDVGMMGEAGALVPIESALTKAILASEGTRPGAQGSY